MQITKKQLQIISEVATEIASREAVKAYQDLLKKQQKERHDRRLRNIKLLLRNYRSFKKYCKDIKLDIDEINEQIEFVTVDSEEFKLQSIRKSKEKTLIMVKYTEKMMSVYKVLTEQSREEDEIRQYKTIDLLYISERRKTIDEVAECHSVARRTVYRDVDKACEALALLMFGIDGVKF